ncbi:hypothetical protein C1H46_034018 [Malus baccata]|uniref:Transmembrane protein n=1 Tax=Malus baccata TaxID=106549 RepID=A0A540L1U5_MALBA|nr:hypothetical protein C1H46_034018 [Malus baccata]
MNEFDWSPNARCDPDGYSYGVNYDDVDHGGFYGGGEQSEGGPISVSSTDGIPADADLQMSLEVVPENKISHEMVPENKTQVLNPYRKAAIELFCGVFFALPAVAIPLLWINDQGEWHDGYHLVPT